MAFSSMMLGRKALIAPQRPGVGVRSRRVPRIRAEKSEEAAKTDQPGFRWDPALQRWLRDDRLAGKDFPTTVKTKTGEEYTVWPVMHTYLQSQGLESVSPEKALEMSKKGYTIIDVRITSEYEDGHASGSKSAPVFRLVPQEKNDFWNMSKKITSALIMQKPTERNPAFLADAEKAAGGKSKLILICGLGGTLKTTVATKKKTFSDPERGFGKESRSLKGCYELLQAGFKDVYHVAGGYSQWRFDGLDTESS
ncbi:hypothetical protein BSKO_00063 [Bryopsis sp. KO-2023]|nr:hypothetical protein BSKO_00063 [Bryopsis sp. KO-2023]